MTCTLLLDLDDTLLTNNIETFLPAYLKALGKYLAKFIPPDRLARELMQATRAMVNNQNPVYSLEEVFDTHFYPAVGFSKEVLQEPITHFYEVEFPKLAHLTSPRQEAIHLVQTALDQGWQVVIATNPLFPRRAIEHRLQWAGLKVECVPFRWITSYETMHFAKPNPAYYAEILGRLGWPQDPVVMIGNSLEEDILPAAVIGIPTFWLDETDATLPSTVVPGSAKGNLAQAERWFSRMPQHHDPCPLTPEAILANLISTPAVFDGMKRDLQPGECNRKPEPDEWCFTEIICHLRDADLEVNLPRLSHILAQENAFISAVNTDEWSATRNYCEEDLELALHGFAAARIELVHQLEKLSDHDWNRQVRHAIFGPTSLLELMRFITTHDRSHIQQAIQTLASVRSTGI
ncbi:MAG TPA: hypothetical protein DEQ80_09830 [Anaerolinea thermolimosa]|uniref:DinB-like domain-containing protein n=1 Tax=Anaerolinea thermolimosa TaxID=229919 RepID=A0A3D1JIU6_9CHLR|nr:hypothetical protein [Anaerolinea thermolimosa]